MFLGCKNQKQQTLEQELLKKWSIVGEDYVDFFTFSTIQEFDNHQFENEGFFDSIKVIIPFGESKIELIPEGNKLKNDLLCVIPLPESRIIRFTFSEDCEKMYYEEKEINFSMAKQLVIEELENSMKANQQIISLIFTDKIVENQVRTALNSINDGYLNYVTNGNIEEKRVNDIEDLSPEDLKKISRFRLVYGIGKTSLEE